MIITPEEQQWIKEYLSNPSLQAELAAGTSTSKAVEPKPKTLIASGGRKKELFGEQKRTKELLKKWWNIYEQGGLYAQAIDMYSYAAFANGYRFEGTENLVQEVEDNFRAFDFDTVGMHAIRQSLIFGDSFEEAVATRGNTSIPVSIVMRDSSTFDIDADEKGIVKGYIQTLPDLPSTRLKPEQIIHLQLIPSGDLYGISLIGRAYDDIMRDTKTAEASAEAIDRHGFKKFHIQIGTEGELVDQSVIDKVSKQFADITTKNEFTTSKDVNIKDLDEGGLEKIEDYSNISLMRAAAALGIPEECIGIRRGSTDATAVARIELWLKSKISAIQRTVARTFTLQYIDRIVEPGQVRLVFNDVSEEDEFKKAQWIGALIGAYAKASPEALVEIEKVVPAKWVQAQFNIVSGVLETPKTKPDKSKPVEIKE